MNSRALAAAILNTVIKDGKKLDEKLKTITQDKAFIKTLCYGVCRYYFRLLPIANKLLQKPLPTKHQDILNLLLLGLYQLIYLDTEAFAAVNETVDAAKQLNKPWACNLLNATLRNFQRQRSTLLPKIDNEATAKYAHPSWLLKIVQESWPNDWQHILEQNNQQAPMTLRVNQKKIDRQMYLAKLQAAKIEATATDYSPNGITLKTPTKVQTLPDFFQGEISVQDEAAQLSANLLDLQKGQRVLDACAAPGGKTCHILETESELELIAVEQKTMRAERIEENLQRLHLQAKILIGDASQPETWWDKKPFDRILLDAPCSASGVIRRHPDIKLLRQRQDLDTLTHTQFLLLERLWPLLKPGGILLYATCSILPLENAELLTRFVKTHHDAKEMVIDANWGKVQSIGRQILPITMDGFYYAKLQKMH